MALLRSTGRVLETRDDLLSPRFQRKASVKKKKILPLLFKSSETFSHHRYLVAFHWSLSDSKSPQVSRSLLGIQVDLNTVVVWMVSTRPLISKSSSLGTNPLVTVPSAPVTIGIPVTFMFHRLFSSLAQS